MRKHYYFLLILVAGVIFGCEKSEKPVSYEIGVMFDIEGNRYNTVRFENQEWICENLNVQVFRNGDTLYNARTAKEWQYADSLKLPAWCYHESNDPINLGIIYNGYAIYDSRNIAPKGWRVAKEEDWDLLIENLGGGAVAGEKLKSDKSGFWLSPNQATNLIQFSALPVGSRSADGSFSRNGVYANWWAITNDSIKEELNGKGSRLEIHHDSKSIGKYYNQLGIGFTVRCIKE